MRRGWLCGRDEKSGQDYELRRGWVEDLAEQLAGLLALEVGFFAVLVNHLHFVLRARPDLVEQWSDEEVVIRHMRFARLVGSGGEGRGGKRSGGRGPIFPRPTSTKIGVLRQSLGAALRVVEHLHAWFSVAYWPDARPHLAIGGRASPAEDRPTS